MRHLILSLFLLISAAAMAQPWGPFTVSDEPGVRNPQICLRNSDTADVFYQVGNDVLHSVVELESGIVTPEPNAFPLGETGYARQLCDVVSIADGWAALVYDSSATENRTIIFSGRNAYDDFLFYLSGYIVNNGFVHDTSYNYALNLCPMVDGGFFASWRNVWSHRDQFCMEGGEELVVIKPDSGDIVISSGDFYSPYPDEKQSMELFGASPDSSILLFSSPTLTASYTVLWAGYPGNYISERTAIGCGVDNAGSLITADSTVFLVSRSFDSTSARVLRIDNLSSCTELRTLADEPIAGASDRDWGLAWLAWRGTGILLYRADTTGAEYLAPGTVHWPETTTIHDAAIAVSHEGRIAAVWTEGAPGSVDATTLRIKSFNWDTPLGTSDRDFIPPPSSFILSAFPNPFNPTTQLSFDLPRAGKTTLQIFDLLGREVARLMDGPSEAGTKNIAWNANAQPSGLYFARLTTPDGIRTIKLCLTK